MYLSYKSQQNEYHIIIEIVCDTCREVLHLFTMYMK